MFRNRAASLAAAVGGMIAARRWRVGVAGATAPRAGKAANDRLPQPATNSRSAARRPKIVRIANFAILLISPPNAGRSEEHTSELQSLMRISYAVLCWKKKKNKTEETH